MLCNNCEVYPATHRCIACPPSDCLLCKPCSEIHQKVKIYKTHSLAPINDHEHETKDIIPTSKKRTDKKSESSSNDLLVEHVESKTQWASHSWMFVPTFLRDVIDYAERKMDSVDLEDFLDNMGISTEGGMSLGGSLKCLIIALSMHVIIKYVLGRRAIFALIGLGIVVYRMLKRKRTSVYAEVSYLSQVQMIYFVYIICKNIICRQQLT